MARLSQVGQRSSNKNGSADDDRSGPPDHEEEQTPRRGMVQQPSEHKYPFCARISVLLTVLLETGDQGGRNRNPRRPGSSSEAARGYPIRADHDEEHYRWWPDLARAGAGYIDRYNRTRRHSSCVLRSPIQSEAILAERAAQADRQTLAA